MINWLRQWREEKRAEREAYLKVLQNLVDTNARTTEAVLAAVTRMTDAQVKQIEAIGTHLSLFKTVEPPSATQMTGAEENRAWAEQHGFPFDGSPEEMAKWIADHDTDD